MDDRLDLENLGYVFYIVSPNTTSFEKVEDVPNYAIQAVPWMMLLILTETAILSYKRKKSSQKFNDSFVSILNGTVTESCRILFDGWKITAYVYIYSNWRIVEFPWDSLWTWWIAFFAADFFYYWTHRASHEVNIIWAAHQVHHSSEYYNLTTALRQSVPLNQLLWFMYLPLAFIIPPGAFMVHFQLNLLVQFWIHTEIIESVGPLEYILNTPSHHRVHHGRNRYCIDKNYAGALIIWDRMFGTFEAEKKNEEIAYGLTHPVNAFEPFYLQFGYTRDVLKAAWKAKGWKHKMSVLFKGPGWEPGKPRLGNVDDIPEVEYPVTKYNPSLPFYFVFYTLVQFIAMKWIYVELLHAQHVMPRLGLYVGVAFMLSACSFLGMIYEGRPYVVWLELLRSTFYIALEVYFFPHTRLPTLSPATQSLVLTLFRTVYTASGIFWLMKCMETVKITWYRGTKKLN